MVVNVVECFDGARRATGVVVVVDVFRAFSVACYIVDNDVAELFAVENAEQARQSAYNSGALLVGEEGDVKADGFDYGNSPSEVKDVDFSGKTVIHATNAGTKAFFACEKADEVITASFVNVGAVVEYIKKLEPEKVTLVALGTDGIMRAQEDMMCAMYIKNELEGYPNSFETLKNFLSKVDSAEMFFDDTIGDAPEQDYALCLDLDRFDFVLRAKSSSVDGVRLEKIKV